MNDVMRGLRVALLFSLMKSFCCVCDGFYSAIDAAVDLHAGAGGAEADGVAARESGVVGL